MTKTFPIVAIALLSAASLSATPATAQYQGNVSKTKTEGGVKGFMERHPKVKGATIGAGVGTAAGAATGLISGKGIARGAAVGAGTGAAVGVVQTSETMKRHPVVKSTATGALVGTGLGLAATRGHGKGKKTAAAAGIGAAVGLGAGVLKETMK